MWVIVGKCGGLWGGREIFPILGCGQFGVYGLRGVQIFTNFDISKKFFNFNIFYDIFFLLKIVNLTNYHKKVAFSLHFANFPYVR